MDYAEACSVAQLLKQAGLTSSTSESLRLIKQGAVKIDGEKLEDPAFVLAQNGTYIVQVGKRRLAKLHLQAINEKN